MNSIIALFSVLLLLLPLAMGWKWYLLLGNFQNCFAFSSSSPREREREREREHFGKRSISVSVLAAQYNVGGGLGRGWRGCKSASDSASSVILFILFIFSSTPTWIISAGCLWSAPAPCSSPSSPSTNRPVLSALLVVSYPFHFILQYSVPFLFHSLPVRLSVCLKEQK